MKWWVEKHGTKLGNFLFYLKRLWTDNPAAKVIVFSSVWKWEKGVKKSGSAQTNSSIQISGLLNKIASLLYEYNVNYSYAEGYVLSFFLVSLLFHSSSYVVVFIFFSYRTTTNRTREIAAFKKDATVRVALLNIYTNASGTNIIEASHVILMGISCFFILLLFLFFFGWGTTASILICCYITEPFQNRGANSIEAQAIARAHRQGQKRNVTVVR